MKKLMKKISFIVAVAVFATILSTGVSIGLAMDATSLLTSGEEGLLRHIGVLGEKEAPDYGKQINRGELAHIAARVMNAPEYTSENGYFHDVPSGNEYFKDIHALVDAGILHGDGNGYYRPLDLVSELEMAKVFSTILGYDVVAEYESYQNIARRAGVFDGTQVDGAITYAEALRIAYNTLHAPMFEALTYGDDPEYRANDDFPAIRCYHNLVKQSGIVKGAWGTDLEHPNESIEEGELLINSRRFRYPDESFLGQAVIFYSGWDSDAGRSKEDIVYLYTDDTKTKVLTIDAEDARGVSGGEYRYLENDVEKDVKMQPDFDVIYNGIAYPAYTDADLVPHFGTVTLVDNNEDDYYDVVLVEAYQYMVVNTVDQENHRFYGKYPVGASAGDDGDDDYFKIINKGKEAKISNVATGDVISYRESKNATGNKKLFVEKLDKSMEVTLEQRFDDSIVASGTEYQLNGGVVIDQPYQLGEKVTIYLDRDKVVAILHGKSTTYTYAYLLRVANMGTPFTSKVSLRVITKDQEEKTLDCAQKLKLDGKMVGSSSGYETFDDFTDALTVSASKAFRDGAEALPLSQMIRYRTNSSGEVTDIDTVTYNAAEEDLASLQLESKNFVSGDGGTVVYDIRLGGAYTNVSTGKFLFSLKDVNSLWSIPYQNRDEEELYTVDKSDNWIYASAAEGYSVDPDTGYADVAILYVATTETGGAININNNHVLVGNVWTEMNEHGELVTGFSHAGTTAKHVYSSDLQSDLAKKGVSLGVGDIIRYAESTGEVKDLEVIYDASEGTMSSNPTVGQYDAGPQGYRRLTIKGVALSLVDNRIKFAKVDKNTPTANIAQETIDYYTISKSTPFYWMDDGKLKKATSGDMITRAIDTNSSQEIVIYTEQQAVRFVYIIK